MLVIVQLSRQALSHPPSLEALAKFAIEHELAVVCGHGAELELIGAVHSALPRHRIVALLADHALFPRGVGLVQELLDEGKLPIVMTVEGVNEDQLRYRLDELADWLDADVRVKMPVEAPSVN